MNTNSFWAILVAAGVSVSETEHGMQADGKPVRFIICESAHGPINRRFTYRVEVDGLKVPFRTEYEAARWFLGRGVGVK